MIPKFRAWWIQDEVMTHIYTLEFLQGGIRVSDGCWHEKFLGDEVILMQSTGLKDKNGVEVYEGDCFIKIFRTIEIPTGKNGIEKSVGIVKFHEGAFQVRIDGWGYELLSEVVQPHIYGANNDYWENIVIGNIYENPELLEVEG